MTKKWFCVSGCFRIGSLPDAHYTRRFPGVTEGMP